MTFAIAAAGCGDSRPIAPGADAASSAQDPLSDAGIGPLDLTVVAADDASVGLPTDASRAPDGTFDWDARPADGSLPDLAAVPIPTGCSAQPPPGAARAAPLPAYTGGTCPDLDAGFNTLWSGGNARAFLLVVPSDLGPNENPPLVFAWHWLNGEAEDFLLGGLMQRAADERRIIVAIPVKKGDLSLFGRIDIPWPFLRDPLASDGRLEEELVFFDDMLACIAEQFQVNRDCVSSIGVSAGALFLTQLASRRSERLASFVSLSGGEGDGDSLGVSRLIRRWYTPTHRLPALVLWGGDDDKCITVDFEAASQRLESQLARDGHFLVECVHNCGHGIWFDPLAVPATDPHPFADLLDFILAHPYWLDAGDSPFLDDGLPESFAPWCGIGANSSLLRVGSCPPASCSR